MIAPYSNATHESETDTVRRFTPDEIFPTQGFRINGTGLRDWQQSVASGRESTEHMLRIAPLLNEYHITLANKFPGAEEAGGGTVPRMDLNVRNEDPYEHVAKVKEKLPNTPLMALIRSDAGAGMEEVAPDVLEGYLLDYHKAGIDVFRNFHSMNDPRAFKRVAKALHKTQEENGFAAHFQAAYSFATYKDDEAVYNARTPVTFFKELVAVLREEAKKDGLEQDAYLPHSYVIKDPSGVLEPKMAAEITRQIKKEMKNGGLPERPFGIHTHNQMGHAAETYQAAIEAGANFVDCAPTPGGYGAQPSMPQLVEALGGGDGAALGFASREAFEAAKKNLLKVDKLSEGILESHDAAVRQSAPDPTVPDHCIAGGQSSVAKGEIKAALERMDKSKAAKEGRPPKAITATEIDAFLQTVKNKMPSVRKELGVPCQVTPTADYVFREASRRAAAVDPATGLNDPAKADREFYCGYRRMMTGEMGPSKEPVNEKKQKQALLERIEVRLARSVSNASKHKEIKESGILPLLRDVMFTMSEPVRKQERFKEVSNRINEMEVLNADGVTNYDLTALKAERDALAPGEAKRKDDIKIYDEFLTTRSEEIAKRIKTNNPDDTLVQYYQNIKKQMPVLLTLQLPVVDNIRLIKTASYTSVPVAELMPPGLNAAEKEFNRLASEGKYRIPEDENRQKRDKVIGRMMRDPHVADPDGMVRGYFQRRDGIVPTEKGMASGGVLAAKATFTTSVSARQLEDTLIEKLLEAGHPATAVNTKITPSQENGTAYHIQITGIKDAATFGYKAIRAAVEALGGEFSVERMPKQPSSSASLG